MNEIRYAQLIEIDLLASHLAFVHLLDEARRRTHVGKLSLLGRTLLCNDLPVFGSSYVGNLVLNRKSAWHQSTRRGSH